jgi:hypothetical protein
MDGPRRIAITAHTVKAAKGVAAAGLRTDRIAHARTLLAGGALGRDVERLADRLIDLALNEGEWLWPADR